MRITILVPFLWLAGGIKAPLHYAEALQTRGHTVTLVAPRRSPFHVSRRVQLRALLGEWWRRGTGQRPIAWFDLRVPLLRPTHLTPAILPPADLTVATDWTTAQALQPAAHLGHRALMIQGEETWNANPAQVHAAWRLPAQRVAVSTRLMHHATERTQAPVDGPLIHGVEPIFAAPPRPASAPPRIGLLYHEMAHKGVADALAAASQLRAAGHHFQLVMYGATPRPNILPADVEYHARPLGARLAQLYRSLDIWVCASHTEGCPMPPMEAMAAGVALVSTDVGAIPDYAQPGESVLLSPPQAPTALAENLARLLSDEPLRLRMATAGYQAMQARSWDAAAADLERLLGRSAG